MKAVDILDEACEEEVCGCDHVWVWSSGYSPCSHV